MNGSAELELYWNPEKAGDYTLMVFSITQEGLASNDSVNPVASIPIKVIEGLESDF